MSRFAPPSPMSRVEGIGPGSSGQCAASPWAALAERVGGTWSQLRAVLEDGQRATSGPLAECLAEAGQLQRGALFLPGRPWPGGYAGTWSRLQAVRRTARQATGRTLGRGRTAPGRRVASPWAALAAWMGGTRSSSEPSGGRPDGPPAGHWPDAGQRPGSSGAVRCASLGRLWGCLCVPLGHNQRPAQSFKSAHVGGFCAALGGAPCPNLPYTKN